MANVPEGLLPTITLALAVGVRRMARRRALVKRLTAVETLGSTDVICTDKTGTLTEGRMTRALLWADGTELDLARPPVGARRRARAVLRAPAHRRALQQRDDRARGRRVAAQRRPERERAARRRGRSSARTSRACSPSASGRAGARYHFDARLKRMTTLDREGDERLWYHAKGAPLELLERCDAVRGADGDRPLAAEDRATRSGRRSRATPAAACASSGSPSGTSGPRPAPPRDQAESGLTFLGLVALEDPPRPDVADAVARCQRAGIRIIVVTGDHGLTAEAIAREVGIVRGAPRIVTGAELDAMREDELDAPAARRARS